MPDDEFVITWKPAPKLSEQLRKSGLEPEFEAGPGLSDPERIPEGEAPVDWLARQKAEYETSALAGWSDRCSVPLLEKLAKFRARYPELGVKLVDYLFAASGQAYQVTTVPLHARERVNRRSSMFAGFPWTSHDYAWPEHGGVASFPIVQLNLTELKLDAFPDLPDCLIQLWGGNGDEEYGVLLRKIDFADIQDVEPDPAFHKADNQHFGFAPADTGRIGLTIRPGTSAFVIPDLYPEIDEIWQQMHDCGRPLLSEKLITKIGAAIDELRDDPDVHGINTGFGKRARFGGVPDLIQESYSDLSAAGRKCLLHIAAVPSLSVLGDGQATIFADRDDEEHYRFWGYVDR